MGTEGTIFQQESDSSHLNLQVNRLVDGTFASLLDVPTNPRLSQQSANKKLLDEIKEILADEYANLTEDFELGMYGIHDFIQAQEEIIGALFFFKERYQPAMRIDAALLNDFFLAFISICGIKFTDQEEQLIKTTSEKESKAFNTVLELQQKQTAVILELYFTVGLPIKKIVEHLTNANIQMSKQQIKAVLAEAEANGLTVNY